MKKGLYFLILLSINIYSQQLTDTIQGTKQILDEVVVQSIRVNNNSPITHSNVYKKELSTRNLGQDLPVLLNYLPSVVTTSSVQQALRSASKSLMRDHLRHCTTKAVRESDDAADQVYDELIELVYTHSR